MILSRRLSKMENSVIVFPGNRKIISTSIPMLPAIGPPRLSLPRRYSHKLRLVIRVGHNWSLRLWHGIRCGLLRICWLVSIYTFRIMPNRRSLQPCSCTCGSELCCSIATSSRSKPISTSQHARQLSWSSKLVSSWVYAERYFVGWRLLEPPRATFW